MMFPFLFTQEIKDLWVQQNFTRLKNYFASYPFTKSEFTFFEIVETGAVTNKDFPHNLGFEPRDIIMLHNLNNVTHTWVYTEFNSATIRYTLGGATTIRFLLGRYAV